MAYKVNRKFPAAHSADLVATLGYVYKLAMIGSGNSGIVSATEDRAIRVFDTSTLKMERELSNAHNDTITDIQPVLNEEFSLISASADGSVKYWDLRQGSAVRTIRLTQSERDAPVHGATVGNNGSVVAASCGSSIHLFDTKRWKNYFTYTDAHSGDISSLAFHPTRPRVCISGASDGLVNLYDVEDLDNEDEGQCPFLTLNLCDEVRSFHVAGSDRLFAFSTTEIVTEWDIGQDSHSRGSKLNELPSVREHPLLKTEDSDDASLGYIVSMISNRRVVAANSSGRLVELFISPNDGHVGVSKLFNETAGSHKGIVRAAVEPHNDVIITAGEDGYLYEWATVPISNGDNPSPSQSQHRERRHATGYSPY